MAILLTGFSAFPGAPANPTEDLVREALWPAPVVTALLPVDWEGAWPALRAAIKETRARHVVMFGLAASASRIRVECIARNRREEGRPDAAGRCAAGTVVANGPAVLSCRFPEECVAAALVEAGIDFEWSQDAGGYLCNDTLYRLAHHADGLGVENYVFVHVPLSEERVADWQAAGAWREGQASVPAVTIRRAAEAIVAAFGGR